MYSAPMYQYRTYQRQRVTREYIRARRKRIRIMIAFLVISFICALIGILSVNTTMGNVDSPEPVDEVEKFDPVNTTYPVISEVSETELINEEPEDVVVEEQPLSQDEILMAYMGDATIEVNGTILTRQKTPDLDYSTFQPYEDYKVITNKKSAAYRTTFSENAYTDENGFRRIPVPDGEFNINGVDDYVVAMGTFYKEKGVCGIRFLIVTDVGLFTVTTGDEKADIHTGDLHMYTLHGSEHQYASVLEYLVDPHQLPDLARRMGSIHYVPFEPLNGTIQMIYRIG